MSLNLVSGESLPWNYKVQTLFAFLCDYRQEPARGQEHRDAADAIWSQMTTAQQRECNDWVRESIPEDLL